VCSSDLDFVYYVPRNTAFSATRITYRKETKAFGRKKKRRAISWLTASEPETFSFFRDYEDGSSAAYCTFMGGDTNTTSVVTQTKNSRRLLILKDSYGNALPSNLFSSFEEIHVVDCRYFLQNMIDFVNAHGITDILFANNLIHASAPKTTQAYALCAELMRSGVNCTFGTSGGLLRHIRRAYDGDFTEEEAVEQLSGVPVLFIDDLGKESPTQWAVERLFDIIDARAAGMKPVVVTTNLGSRALRQRYGEPGGPMISRLCGNGAVAVRFDGPDRRLHG
jgi:hypothetical protein